MLCLITQLLPNKSECSNDLLRASANFLNATATIKMKIKKILRPNKIKERRTLSTI